MEDIGVVTKTDARIANPHSVYVEHIISTNNLLKSIPRTSMNIITVHIQLLIYYNMPAIEDWDTRTDINNGCST